MRLPVTLAALAAAAFLALPPPAQAGGLQEIKRVWDAKCAWIDSWFRRDAPAKPAAKPMKAKAPAKKM
jgi:hypothetical protein